jgi:hypothetical protein
MDFQFNELELAKVFIIFFSYCPILGLLLGVSYVLYVISIHAYVHIHIHTCINTQGYICEPVV